MAEAACARCHALPPPDALPRDAWADAIASMAAMPVHEGITPLSAEELAAAEASYTARAPEALEPIPAAPESELSFTVEHFHPGHEAFAGRVPATAHVAFVPLSDAERLDLLVAELRSSALFLLAPWAPGDQRELRLLGTDLHQPAHLQLTDLDRDGRRDLLVASLGSLDPTNDPTGAVRLMRQVEGRRFATAVLADGVGRVSDARAADLDGDGDSEVVAAAFGWRGPGGLLLLDGDTRTTLDDRDGFVHVEPVDLDGDGDLDLVTVLSQEHEQVVLFRNPGFEPEVLHQAPHPAWGTSGLQVVDLDGDGDPDLLVSNGDALDDDQLKPYHGVAWLENRGDRFAYHRIGALYGCERAVAGDLDGDGDLDVIAVSFLPHLDPGDWKGLPSIAWFERRGDGWHPRVLERGRNIHPTVAAGDYDADGDLDLAVGNYVWMVADGQPSFRADAVTLLTRD